MDNTTTYETPLQANLNPATSSTRQLWYGLSIVFVFAVILAIVCLMAFVMIKGAIYCYGLFAAISTSWQFIAGLAVGAVAAVVPQVITWKVK